MVERILQSGAGLAIRSFPGTVRYRDSSTVAVVARQADAGNG